VSVSFAVIPGAGSAGLTWRPVAGRLGARVLPMPPEESVFEIAASLQPDETRDAEEKADEQAA